MRHLDEVGALQLEGACACVEARHQRGQHREHVPGRRPDVPRGASATRSVRRSPRAPHRADAWRTSASVTMLVHTLTGPNGQAAVVGARRRKTARAPRTRAANGARPAGPHRRHQHADRQEEEPRHVVAEVRPQVGLARPLPLRQPPPRPRRPARRMVSTDGVRSAGHFRTRNTSTTSATVARCAARCRPRRLRERRREQLERPAGWPPPPPGSVRG